MFVCIKSNKKYKKHNMSNININFDINISNNFDNCTIKYIQQHNRYIINNNNNSILESDISNIENVNIGYCKHIIVNNHSFNHNHDYNNLPNISYLRQIYNSIE